MDTMGGYDLWLKMVSVGLLLYDKCRSSSQTVFNRRGHNNFDKTTPHRCRSFSVRGSFEVEVIDQDSKTDKQ